MKVRAKQTIESGGNRYLVGSVIDTAKDHHVNEVIAERWVNIGVCEHVGLTKIVQAVKTKPRSQ